MARVLTPVFSVTPCALSSVVRLGIALCTLLPSSVLSGEFQAHAQPCQLSFKHYPPSKAITQAVLCHPLCLPSCAGHSCVDHKGLVHFLQGECVEGSVAVRRDLEGQLKHRCICTKAQPHPTQCGCPHSISDAPQNTPQSTACTQLCTQNIQSRNPCLDLEISNIWGHLEVSSETNLKPFT